MPIIKGSKWTVKKFRGRWILIPPRDAWVFATGGYRPQSIGSTDTFNMMVRKHMDIIAWAVDRGLIKYSVWDNLNRLKEKRTQV